MRSPAATIALLAAAMAGGAKFSPDGGRAARREPEPPTPEDLDRKAARIAKRNATKLRTWQKRTGQL